MTATVTALSTSAPANALLTHIFMDCLGTFRFERVEKTMDALEWKWVVPGRKDYTERPSISLMRDQCWILFNRCMETLADDPDLKDAYSSSGGFRVTVNRDTREVRITFEAEYAANYP